VCLIACGSTTHSFAQSPYSLRTGREVALVGSGLAVSAAALALHQTTEPLTEGEIASLSRSDVIPLDRGATYQYSASAETASNWLIYALISAPLALTASDGVREDAATYGTMYGESLLLTLAAVQLTKGLVLRPRPYVYNPDAPLDEKTVVDSRMSFYSSHTAFAFASAVFMGVAFEAYEPHSPLGPWIWAASLTAAAAVGVLRYTSGSHFPTDILVGAAVGALAGWAVPALHRTASDELVRSPAFGNQPMSIAFRISL
jgi:membrane-associated phospholipid phosphatase